MDIIHVCIPFSNKFIKIVSDTIEQYRPGLVIIHSTVEAGTTKKLFKMHPCVTHSPCRGVHPNLHEGIKTFVKFVGCEDQGLGLAAEVYLDTLGIKAKYVGKSINTELGKLLDTTYYGVAIAFHGYASKICKKYKADFDIVMTEFNETYNHGYQRLGKENVIRPVLYAPKGKIGGHCVRENSIILKRQNGNHNLLDAILNTK